MSGAPKLSNDCFALPPGVDWTPVDVALSRLREGITPVTGIEPVPVVAAEGRVLAAPVRAKRANPPYANSAVDGYGFANSSLSSGRAQTLQLCIGRAAAGVPFAETVPGGFAIRILTGAMLPAGVDTVVLQEDVSLSADTVSFETGLKPGANTRPAGEDVTADETLFTPGHTLGPQDLALLAATGIAGVSVHKPLRVGVLSTGDEVVPLGQPALAHQIYDANRPMLLTLLARWGMVPVDLGHAPDQPDRIAEVLSRAARSTDAVLTTGGASAGDEDHVSALLGREGKITTWRIAMKPGRPLALGFWEDVPVFGLPGNPVAAFVCALIFARPALGKMAGMGWFEPPGLMLPAAFEKRKKPGRREYLRARLTPGGAVEVFDSEGSGRISGLSWAQGLVELPDGAMEITAGTPVRYLPFSGFRL